MQNFFRERKKDISFVNITWSLSTLAKVSIAKKQKDENDYFDDGKIDKREISESTGWKAIWLWWNKNMEVSFDQWMQMKIKAESPSELMKKWNLHLCRIGNPSF